MLGDALQRVAGLLVLPQRRFAGDRFDAPHARRDAAFVHDLADADIAGARARACRRTARG